MKQLYFLIAVVLCTATGCGNKKDASGSAEQHIFQIDSVDQVTGVQRMQVSRIHQDIVSQGKKYHLFIDRAPSDSLSRVKSDLGTFADNRIVLKITRENGTTLFSKTFTKQSFSSFLSDGYLNHFMLEGMVFDDEKTKDSKNIVLAASVSIPMTDLYIPFSITITPDGKMTILKDEDMGELSPLEVDSLN
ncbi:DUF4738 domain-containing protein [Phocaeicola sp.]